MHSADELKIEVKRIGGSGRHHRQGKLMTGQKNRGQKKEEEGWPRGRKKDVSGSQSQLRSPQVEVDPLNPVGMEQGQRTRRGGGGWGGGGLVGGSKKMLGVEKNQGPNTRTET